MHLSEPKPTEWQSRFEQHQRRIRKVIPEADTQHIGSTAIPGIYAKDVVDVLVGGRAGQIGGAASRLVAAGYVQEGARDGHIWLCSPAPEQREAVVHVVLQGGEIWQKRLAFRDHLRQHPAEAKAYEALKRRLAAQTDDWNEYTSQKAEFVARIVNQVRRT